jgi:ABC-type polysaccharide/polyol phosphate export permease
MTVNVGTIDRILRALVGIVLIAIALGFFGPAHAWGWIGIIPLVTALIGYCPLYSLIGVSTCRRA